MHYNEYVKAEMELRGQLARRDRRMSLVRETFFYAGPMALVLAIADALPWSFDSRPLRRLGFILFWAVTMAFWQLSRVRGASEGRAPVV